MINQGEKGTSSKNSVLASLQTGFTDPVRDILWGHIYLTPALADLTKSVPFMRLHRIMQLGPTFCVYPGATHTRASHSIGVYHLAKRVLVCLAERGADKWLSRKGVFSFLCAALLHDLGHFPFTHSLKELPLESHESLTAKIICSPPVKSLVAKAGGDPDFTAAIIDSEMNYTADNELTFYRSLLSGTLDPDKLDYLNRDARYCGVPYGAQDVDFILSCLHPHPERGADMLEKGIPGIESLLFSKYLMYRTVYWHRLVRSATAMIKKAVLGSLESGSLSAEELYGLDDQGFFNLTNDPLIQAVRDGKLYAPVAEFPFSSVDEKAQISLLDIKDRSRLEASLAGALADAGIFGIHGKIPPEDLIIDIPEPVSFESNLYIKDEACFFPESSSAFKREMIDTLVKSLRIIRVFLKNPPTMGKRILNITQKWVKLLV